MHYTLLLGGDQNTGVTPAAGAAIPHERGEQWILNTHPGTPTQLGACRVEGGSELRWSTATLGHHRNKPAQGLQLLLPPASQYTPAVKSRPRTARAEEPWALGGMLLL
jgi:hypothetical protein